MNWIKNEKKTDKKNVLWVAFFMEYIYHHQQLSRHNLKL
jgi:hypothetical protein